MKDPASKSGETNETSTQRQPSTSTCTQTHTCEYRKRAKTNTTHTLQKENKEMDDIRVKALALCQ